MFGASAFFISFWLGPVPRHRPVWCFTFDISFSSYIKTTFEFLATRVVNLYETKMCMEPMLGFVICCSSVLRRVQQILLISQLQTKGNKGNEGEQSVKFIDFLPEPAKEYWMRAVCLTARLHSFTATAQPDSSFRFSSIPGRSPHLLGSNRSGENDRSQVGVLGLRFTT